MTDESLLKLHDFVKLCIIPHDTSKEFLSQMLRMYVEEGYNISHYNKAIDYCNNENNFKTEYSWNISIIPNSNYIMSYSETRYNTNSTIVIWREDYICYVYGGALDTMISDIHISTPVAYRGNRNTTKYINDLIKIIQSYSILLGHNKVRITSYIPYIEDIFKNITDEKDLSDGSYIIHKKSFKEIWK